MACKEFHHWLRTRDIHDKDTPEAMVHMATCADCRRLYALDTSAEQAIARTFAGQDLPQTLVDRIGLGLGETNPPFSNGGIPGQSSFPKYAGWVAGILVLLAALVFSLRPPVFKNLEQVSQQAVMDHLKGNRHITFDNTSLYQALERFQQELGFNVLLPNLGDQCFIVGGRLCFLGECKAAYFVIENQGKTGSLFIMDASFLDFKIADGTRFSTTVKGCATQVWKENGQVYAMVF